MRSGLRVGCGAMVQVLLVTANSIALAAYESSGEPSRVVLSAGLSFLISWIWWNNARAASAPEAGPNARVWYAAGAAAGTVIGAALAYNLVS